MKPVAALAYFWNIGDGQGHVSGSVKPGLTGQSRLTFGSIIGETCALMKRCVISLLQGTDA